MIVPLATYKTFMGIAQTDNSNDTLLNIYLTGLDALFDRRCDREFDSTAYVNELYDGTGSQLLYLRNYPISVAPIVWSGRTSAINIRNTDTTVTYAQVLVDKDNAKLTLTIAGGANAGSDDVEFGTYTTLATVVAQIGTLGKGWTVSIYDSDLSSELSTQLLPVSVMCGSQRGNTASDETLEIPDEPINIERFEPTLAGLFRSSGFAPGFQRYAVSYTAGYTAAAMPNDLIEAVCEGAMALFERGKEGGFGVVSFSQGGLTTRYQEWLPASTLKALEDYARKVIV